MRPSAAPPGPLTRNGRTGVRRGPGFETLQHLDGPDVLRPLDLPVNFDGIITNEVIQNSLQMIEVLEFAKDQLPQQ